MLGRNWTVGSAGCVPKVFLAVAGGSLVGGRTIHIPGYHTVVEPAFGNNQERHDSGQLQERSAPAGALGRYQWLALSSSLCKVPAGH